MNWNFVLSYAFLACCIACAATAIVANAKVLPEQQDWLRVFFWRTKEEFTADGWRFRQVSLLFCYFAFGIGVLKWWA